MAVLVQVREQGSLGSEYEEDTFDKVIWPSPLLVARPYSGPSSQVWGVITEKAVAAIADAGGVVVG